MTATCATCGRTLKLPELKRWFRSPHMADARAAIAQVNARLSGHDAMEELAEALAPEDPETEPIDVASYEDLAEERVQPLAGVVARARSARGIRSRVEAVAREVAADLGDFTETEFEMALEQAELDPSKAEQWLRDLVTAHILYERRAGRFALL